MGEKLFSSYKFLKKHFACVLLMPSCKGLKILVHICVSGKKRHHWHITVADRKYSKRKARENIMLVRKIRAGCGSWLKHADVWSECRFVHSHHSRWWSCQWSRNGVQFRTTDYMTGQETGQTEVSIRAILLPTESHYSNSILKLLQTRTGEFYHTLRMSLSVQEFRGLVIK